ncbi:glycoside hydrolase domain-containing protein [Planctomycetota bacterium]
MKAIAILLTVCVVVLAVGPLAAQEPRELLADFEDNTAGAFELKTGTIKDHEQLTGKAVHMIKGASLGFWDGKGKDWSVYNCIRFDIYNPTDDRIIVPVVFKDAHYDKGWFYWVNRRFPAVRGKSTITIELAKLKRGDGGSKDPKDAPALTWDRIIQFIIQGPADIGEYYIDNIRLEKADLTPPPAPPKYLLADFNDGKAGELEPRKGAAVKDCEQLDGKAMHMPAKSALFYERPGSDWSQYDFIKIDFYNPSQKNISLNICIKDTTSPHGYYSWINRYPSVRPGRSTMELNIKELRRGEGSPKDMLDPRPFQWNNFWQFIVGTKGELYADNVRLEKADVKTFEGLFAFDFGPPLSAPLLGYTVVSPKTAYTKEQGFGWTRTGGMWTRERKHPPDIFFGDWVSTSNGIFAVDVPNGDYKVWIGWTDPGEWEFIQNFTRRAIHAEDKPLMQETMNGSQFLDKIFKNAEVEDRPGEDIRAKYCGHFSLRPFDVTVTDGQLNLKITGSGQYAATVNGLVIYPAAKAAEGDAFVKSSDQLRAKYYGDRWLEHIQPKQKPDETIVAQAGERGYALFARPKSQAVGYFDAPQAGEQMADQLRAFAARGEYEPFVFSLYALKDLKGVNVTVSPFKNADGEELPAAVDIRYVSWKFRRAGHGEASQYHVVPFILRKAKPIDALKGTPRRFWLTAQVPADAKAGMYEATAAITADNAPPAEVKLQLQVFDFALPEADMGLAMFGVGGRVPWSTYAFTEIADFVTAARDKSLRYAREHGMNYISLSSRGVYKGIENKQARFDMAAIKKEYERCVALGFTHIDIMGPGHGIWRQAAEGDDAAAVKAGFANADELVKALYGGFREACKQAGMVDPIWRMGDEPPESQAPVFVDMYSRIKRVAGAGSSISFSPHGENQLKLLDVMSVSCLNMATMEHFERAKKAGNRLYVNNQGNNRWAYGVWMHKLNSVGVEAFRQFMWLGNHIDPYYPLDGHEDDGGRVFPDREHNMRPLEVLERVREGIDDYRYLQLMKSLARKKPDSEAGKQALEFYNSILKKADFKTTREGRQAKMTDKELDQMRLTAVQHIRRLLQR